MSQKNDALKPVVTEVKNDETPKVGRLAGFRANHPRLSKALLITGGLLAIGGGLALASKKAGSGSSDDTYDDGFNGTVEVTDSPSED